MRALLARAWRLRAPRLVCLTLLMPHAAAAQTDATAAVMPDASRIVGPVAPATIAREPDGRVSLRAVRLTAPLRIDGRLDDEFYRTVPAMSDFAQIEPREGLPATERTEVWIAFDEQQVYFAFRCWDSHPELRVAKEMRRDNGNIWNGDDNVAFMIDTFFDHRNSFQFTLNSIGGRQDAQVFNERQWSGDWNTIWSSATASFENGWTAEVAIPFKSLRYQPGREQIWGFNAMRTNRWKNELSFLAPVPKSLGQRGLLQASLAAPLVGLSVPPGSRNLEIKPYAIANAKQERDAHGVLLGDVGVDTKYGLTQNLTADFTCNTDFGQIEADEQQLNLTRYALHPTELAVNFSARS